MKKIFWAFAIFVLFALPMEASPYVFTSPIDSILALGTGAPDDFSEKLYLANALGISGLDAEKVAQINGVYSYRKDEAIGALDKKDLAGGWNPGFAWDYAIVKVDGPNDYWYLFIDDNASLSLISGDDILTTPVVGTDPFNTGRPPKGISHISWFSSTAVPEPATIILLGLGLLGVARLRKKAK